MKTAREDSPGATISDRPDPQHGGNPAIPPTLRSVSIDTAAMLLCVSRRTIYNLIRQGKLETIRTLGGSQRVLVSSMPVVRG